MTLKASGVALRQAVLLIDARRTFIGGSDIRELKQHDPVFRQPSPLIVDLVKRRATLASLDRSA
jgi:hypothetical protein